VAKVKPDFTLPTSLKIQQFPVDRHDGGASTRLADLLSMCTTAHLLFLAQLGQIAHQFGTRFDVLIFFNTFPRLDVPSINVGEGFFT
jgi:hypothetical protein